MTDKLIVVVGVTGKQGGSVARTFLEEPGWRVRGITRDPAKASTKDLADAGVELVQGDLDDASSLLRAFDGASAIFGVTDFWQFVRNPATHAAAAAAGVPINRAAHDRELAQSTNLLDAAAAHAATLDRFVLSTLSDTAKWSGGKYTRNLHFDAKAAAVCYLRAAHPALAAKTSFLQLGSYFDNWQMAPLFCPQKVRLSSPCPAPLASSERPADARSNPTATSSCAWPTHAPPQPTPYVSPATDTGPCARALVLSPAAPPGTVLVACSVRLTAAAWAAEWTRVLRGRGLLGPAQACAVDAAMSVAEAEDAVQAAMGGVAFGRLIGREVAESCLYTTEFGWAGGDPEVKWPRDVGVAMDELSSLEEYLQSEDWSAIL